MRWCLRQNHSQRCVHPSLVSCFTVTRGAPSRVPLRQRWRQVNLPHCCAPSSAPFFINKLLHLRSASSPRRSVDRYRRHRYTPTRLPRVPPTAPVQFATAAPCLPGSVCGAVTGDAAARCWSYPYQSASPSCPRNNALAVRLHKQQVCHAVTVKIANIRNASCDRCAAHVTRPSRRRLRGITVLPGQYLVAGRQHRFRVTQFRPVRRSA